MMNSLKVKPVFLILGSVWLIHSGFFIVKGSFFVFPKSVIADAQPDAGNISVAFIEKKPSVCLVLWTVQRLRVPKDGLGNFSVAEKPCAKIAKNFCTWYIICKGGKK